MAEFLAWALPPGIIVALAAYAANASLGKLLAALAVSPL